MKYYPSYLKNILSIFLLIFFLALNFGFGINNASIAVVTKTILEVMKKSASNNWTNAEKGDMLVGGDQIKTGKKSLAVVKFKDNSIIRLHEHSELTVNGEGTPGAIIKSALLTSGSIGFDIKKQENAQFRLTSPTSVASIRGTMGKWSRGDTLVVTKGLVNLKNLISNKDIDVSAGEIGFSKDDGSISSRKATENELVDANNAANGGNANELKLEMKDSKGNKKELKLRYKQ